jgi:hypothetical protein
MPNRHERRKAAAVFELGTMTTEQFLAAGIKCAWDGCTASFHRKDNEYMPPGWTVLLVFKTQAPVYHIWNDVPPSDMLRDANLCPEHTEMLDRMLCELPSKAFIREAMGNA